MFKLAAMLAANPMLVEHAHSPDPKIQAAFETFARQHSIPLEGGLDVLSETQFGLFQAHWKAWCHQNQFLSGSIPEPNSVPIVELELPPSQFLYLQRGFIYEDERSDETSSSQPNQATASRREDSSGVDTLLSASEPRNESDIEQCIARISRFTDTQLYSPRIKAIMERVRMIRHGFPDDKACCGLCFRHFPLRSQRSSVTPEEPGG